MTQKYHFISAEDLLYDSYRLAKQVLESDFKPNFLVGIWRGGTPVGIAVQEFLAYHNILTDHIAIRTARYDNNKIDQAASEIRVFGLEYLIKKANAEDRLLFIDDVYDTGLTIREVKKELMKKSRMNTPKEIRIGTVYYKPEKNKTDCIPDFYLYETEQWLVFPHELRGLSLEEIKQAKGPRIAELFAEIKR